MLSVKEEKGEEIWTKLVSILARYVGIENNMNEQQSKDGRDVCGEIYRSIESERGRNGERDD
mgnify:CR=1 FL=1